MCEQTRPLKKKCEQTRTTKCVKKKNKKKP